MASIRSIFTPKNASKSGALDESSIHENSVHGDPAANDTAEMEERMERLINQIDSYIEEHRQAADITK